jgi:hypothetical protein
MFIFKQEDIQILLNGISPHFGIEVAEYLEASFQGRWVDEMEQLHGQLPSHIDPSELFYWVA